MLRFVSVLLFSLVCFGCASGPSARIAGERVDLEGIASYYGPGFHGKTTASGERFNKNAMTAAHYSLPFGTRVRVTHAETGKSIVVRINDRMPNNKRVIDLSEASFAKLSPLARGLIPVRLKILSTR